MAPRIGIGLASAFVIGLALFTAKGLRDYDQAPLPTFQNFSVPFHPRPAAEVYATAETETAASPEVVREPAPFWQAHFPGARVLEQEETPTDATGRGFQRWLLETDFKYPYVVMEAEFQQDPNTGAREVVSTTGMVANQLLVRRRAAVSDPDFRLALRVAGGKVLQTLDQDGLYLVEWPLSGMHAITSVMAMLETDPARFTKSEPNVLYFTASVPDDPGFDSSWGLHNTSAPGVDIRAEAGWDIRSTAENVVVGIIDSGLRLTHEDIRANLWTNAKEVPGNNVDDDHNGLVDDLHGWDFYADKGNTVDESNHGSHVAGVIGAVGNNGRGASGVAWQVKLMPLKFLGKNGVGATSDAVRAIRYAVGEGVDLFNASWGGDRFNQALYDAVSDLNRLDIPFVTAAGNNGRDIDKKPSYPACFDQPNVIVVGNMERNGNKGKNSNFGAKAVRYFAPGTQIYGLSPNADDAYQYRTGTSQAAPFVSGILALLMAQDPQANTQQLIAKLDRGVVRTEALSPYARTGGFTTLSGSLRADAVSR